MRKSAARYSSLIRKLGLEPVAVLRMGQTPKFLLGKNASLANELFPVRNGELTSWL